MRGFKLAAIYFRDFAKLLAMNLALVRSESWSWRGIKVKSWGFMFLLWAGAGVRIYLL